MDPVLYKAVRWPRRSDVISVEFAADDSYFAAACGDGHLRLYTMGGVGGERTSLFKGNKSEHNIPIARTCITQFRRTGALFVGDDRGHVIKFSASVREKPSWFTPHQARVTCVNFDALGHQLVTASRDGTAKFHDFQTWHFIGSLRGHQGWVNAASFSADGAVIVTGSSDRTVKIWDVRTQEATHTIPLPGPVSCASIMPGAMAGLLAIGTETGVFRLVDTRNTQVVQNYPDCHRGSVASARVHPSGLFVLTGGSDSRAKIMDLVDGHLFYEIQTPCRVSDVRWNADGSRFAIAGGNEVGIWETKFDKLLENVQDSVPKPTLMSALEVAPQPKAKAVPREGPLPSQAEVERRLGIITDQLRMLTDTVGMLEKRSRAGEMKLAALRGKL